MSSLRRLVFERTGYNLGRCQSCQFCDKVTTDTMDVSLSTLVQMVLFNDHELFATRTLWSDEILDFAGSSCNNSFDLMKVIVALRQIAEEQGLASKK